jgi:carbonyl reductase 1
MVINIRAFIIIMLLAPSSCLSGRVALVTGANKGIGLEIARGLALEASSTVLLGCRDEALGAAAVAQLRASGCTSALVSLRLDLTDTASIAAVQTYVAREHGKLDCLINNAAVCFNDPTLYGKVPHTPFQRQAAVTVNTNFFGTLALTQALLPLLRASASPRVVNVASYAGRLAILKSPEKVALFTAPTLDTSQLAVAMRQFITDVEGGVHASKGWPNTCYGMSKLGLIAYTRILARDEPALRVNSVDPGYCATDQNQNQGYLSAAQGAQTPLQLALLPAQAQFLSGMLFREGAEVEW